MIKRSVFSVTCALCLVFVLAACGTDNTAGTGSGGSATVISAVTSASGTMMTGGTIASGTMMAGSTVVSGTMMAGGTMVAGTMMPGSTAGANMVDAAIPVYPGATQVTLPDMLTSAMGQMAGSISNIKYAAYKTTDGADKIKAFFTDKLTQSGWKDNTAQVGTAMAGGMSTASANSTAMPSGTMQAGGTAVAGLMSQLGMSQFQKDTKGVAIVSYPPEMSAMLQIPGVNQGETVFIVLSGDEKAG